MGMLKRLLGIHWRPINPAQPHRGNAATPALARSQQRSHPPIPKSKMGFLGVLDPLASGVLPVFVGKATRLIPQFEGLDKRYIVTCRLGQTTNTLDAEGEVLREREVKAEVFSRIPEVLQTFEGEMLQEAPIFSALKIQGKPSYVLARQGVSVVPKQRRVRFWDITLKGLQPPHRVTFGVSCTAGSYIRSLVRDIGEVLGTGAHVCALQRIFAGSGFFLENALTHGQIAQQLQQPQKEWTFVHSPLAFLPHCWVVTVDEAQAKRIQHGMVVSNVEVGANPFASSQKTLFPPPIQSTPQPGFACNSQGKLLALGTFLPTSPLGSQAINTQSAPPFSSKNQTSWCFTPKQVLG